MADGSNILTFNALNHLNSRKVENSVELITNTQFIRNFTSINDRRQFHLKYMLDGIIVQ
jgi:hypothetical protein